MGSEDAHRLGYKRVDDDANVSVLVSTMDATAGWEATRRMRSWERSQLSLIGGQRLLDVGCGLGEAALRLAADLDADGELVGVDLSAEMLRVARSQANTARCRVRFTEGDACSLAEPDGSFDVVRSERTLQWLTDPLAAVREMVRVAKPGGRVSLIDTDWSTFEIDVGDDELARRVRNAMHTERSRPSNIGGRLHELTESVGCAALARFETTHTWTAWDPDRTPAPDGCFSMRSLADDLVDRDQLSPDDRERFVSTIEDAARSDRFSMQLTMHAVVAETPAS